MRIIFIILGILLLSSFVLAQFGFDNRNLPSLIPEDESGSAGANVTSVSSGDAYISASPTTGNVVVTLTNNAIQWLYNQTNLTWAFNQSNIQYNFNQSNIQFNFNQSNIAFNYNQTGLGFTNIFNQNLNTTSNVRFANLTVNGNFSVMNGSNTVFYIDPLTQRVGIGTNNTNGAGLNLFLPAGGLNLVIDKATTNPQMEFRLNGASKWNLYTDSSTSRFVIRNAGGGADDVISILNASNNVGISTTTPGYKLHVNGNVSLNNSLFVNTNGLVGIGNNAPTSTLTVNGNLSVANNLSVDGNTLFVDNVNNRVGINTYSPVVSLEVSGSDLRLDNPSGSAIFTIDSSATNTFPVIRYAHANTPYWETGSDANAGANERFYIYNHIAGAYALVINRSNNYIGLGTTTPDEPLHIVTGTDENLVFADAFTLATGLGIGTYNDAITANVPLELRTTHLAVTGFPSTILNNTGEASGFPAYFTFGDESAFSAGFLGIQGFLQAGNDDIDFSHGFVALESGSVTGFSMSFDVGTIDASCGSLTHQVWINNTGTGGGSTKTMVWSNNIASTTGNGKSTKQTQAKNADRFVAGDMIALALNSSTSCTALDLIQVDEYKGALQLYYD